jgi:hypothetical protein
MEAGKMIEIVLLDKDAMKIKNLELDPAKVAEAACIIHEGRYFVYNGSGRGNIPRYYEVNPPVEV